MVVSLPRKLVFSFNGLDHILHGSELLQIFEWEPIPNQPKRYAIEVYGGHSEIRAVFIASPESEEGASNLEKLLESLVYHAQSAESRNRKLEMQLEASQYQVRQMELHNEALKQRICELETRCPLGVTK